MPLAADTHPESDTFQLEAYRRMGGMGRVEIVFRLIAMTRLAAEGGIRRRHPEYDDAQVLRALARLLHGDELARGAWPDRELLEP